METEKRKIEEKRKNHTHKKRIVIFFSVNLGEENRMERGAEVRENEGKMFVENAVKKSRGEGCRLGGKHCSGEECSERGGHTVGQVYVSPPH